MPSEISTQPPVPQLGNRRYSTDRHLALDRQRTTRNGALRICAPHRGWRLGFKPLFRGQDAASGGAGTSARFGGSGG